MTSYVVQGTFPEHYPGTSIYLPGLDISGTIDITGGILTAMDIVVPGFALHFTQIYYNQPYNGGWIVTGQTPGSCTNFINCQEDYLVIPFMPLPAGPQLLDFQQARITGGGSVTHIVYTDPEVNSPWAFTTYYGFGLTGTICPLEGCAPWPVQIKAVPGPVAGAELPGLLAFIIFGVLFWKRRSGHQPPGHPAHAVMKVHTCRQ